jgi:hypothetical protein
MLFSLFKGRKKDAEVVDVLEARHDTCGEAQQAVTDTEGDKEDLYQRIASRISNRNCGRHTPRCTSINNLQIT